MAPDSNAGNCGQLPPPQVQEVCTKSSLSRQRYGELVQLGIRASKELTEHGLQRSEYCEFGRIMEKIINLEYRLQVS